MSTCTWLRSAVLALALISIAHAEQPTIAPQAPHDSKSTEQVLHEAPRELLEARARFLRAVFCDAALASKVSDAELHAAVDWAASLPDFLCPPPPAR
jgi:hypothetical protein